MPWFLFSGLCLQVSPHGARPPCFRAQFQGCLLQEVLLTLGSLDPGLPMVPSMVVPVWGQVYIWTESLGQAGLGLCPSLLRPWLRAWVRHSGMGANRKQRKEGGRQFIPWGGGGHEERATQDLNSVTRDLDCFPRETCDLTLLSALCPELRDWWMRTHAPPWSYTLDYHSNSVHTVCVCVDAVTGVSQCI